MSQSIMITSIRFTPAPRLQQRGGLLGWASFAYGGLLVDGVGVRRAHDHRVILTFPSRRSRSGRQHPYVRPLNAHSRAEIERAVLDAIHIPDADTGTTRDHGGRTR